MSATYESIAQAAASDDRMKLMEYADRYINTYRADIDSADVPYSGLFFKAKAIGCSDLDAVKISRAYRNAAKARANGADDDMGAWLDVAYAISHGASFPDEMF